MSLRTVPSVPYNGLSSTFLSGGGSFAIPSGSGGAMTLTGWSGLTAGQILYPSNATTLTSSANLTFTDSPAKLLLGTSASLSTATPVTLNLGGTYADAPGVTSKMKLKVYDDGTVSYGFGVSISNLEYHAWDASNHSFYEGGVLRAWISGTDGQGFSILAGAATTDLNALSITQTWNNAAVAFNGWKFVITDTASAAGALAENILGGSAGTTVLRQTTKGGHHHAGGNAPSITAGGGTDPSIAGTDEAFTVTVGSGGLATSVEVTFATAFAVAPRCAPNHEGAILILRAVSTTQKVTIDAATPFTALGKITCVCRSGTT